MTTTQVLLAEKIPTALRERAQWVVWRLQTRKGDDKPTKVPYNARTGDFAKSDDKSTWCDFNTALHAYLHGRTRHGAEYTGIGYVFTKDDPYTGIDLDDCITDGTMASWAVDILEKMSSYSEVSPSGTGVKIWVEGEIPNSIKLAEYHSGGIEMYDTGRFFTVTGNTLSNNDIRYVNGELSALYNDVAEKRDAMRKRKYVDAAFNREITLLRETKDGGRNNQLYDSTNALRKYVQSGDLIESDVRAALEDAALATGLPLHEIENTINSAFRGDPPKTFNLPQPTQTASAPAHDTTSRDETLSIYNANFFLQGITAKELRSREFQPLQWAIQDVLPEGCTLLAGKPKARKSWLALNFGLAVSLGGKAMGQKAAEKGRVLYLDLESNQRRAQRRLTSALRDMEWPENFHIFNEWPKLDVGGITLLEAWIEQYPDTRLIIVDVFQDIRPISNPKAQLYDTDREAIAPLRKFASKHHVAVLVIHHTRKAKGDDVFDEISGSTGLTGGVDNIMVLTRDAESADFASLSVRGRDLEFDDALPLAWDMDFCQWRVIEDRGVAASTTKERKDILNLLSDGEKHRPKDIAVTLHKEPKNISKLLRSLESEGLVACVGFGQYCIADNNNNDNYGRSGRSGRSSGDGRSGRSGIEVPFLPIPPAGYRAVEVGEPLESQETATSTTSTTSTTSVEAPSDATQSYGVFDWPFVQRCFAAGDIEGVERHCKLTKTDYSVVMAELTGVGEPETSNDDW